jgi:hypothetical protein
LFCAVLLVQASARARSRGVGSRSRLPAARDSSHKNSELNKVNKKIFRNFCFTFLGFLLSSKITLKSMRIKNYFGKIRHSEPQQLDP